VADLDQQRTARPPTQWTGERVRERLVEAFAIERRMPGQHFATIASAWPATPVHSFADIVHWEPGAVMETWSTAKGVYSYEVTKMEEAFAWLPILPEGERRCLTAWAMASSRGLSVRAMIEKRHWSRTTFYRRIEQAAERIADRLNRQGVVVR
jgi:hypothetical protein